LTHFPEIRVFDDFLKDPEAVRQSALASGFGTWRPNKGAIGDTAYDGINFYGDHARVIEAVYRKAGFLGIPNSMCFRVTNEGTERAYVHSDNAAGDMTCIVYLSRHSDRYGTGFYRHRESDSVTMPSLSELIADPTKMAKIKAEISDSSEKYWQEEQFVQGAFNRAVIFKSACYHRRFPIHGFGSGPEDGRMIHISHYKAGEIQ